MSCMAMAVALALHSEREAEAETSASYWPPSVLFTRVKRISSTPCHSLHSSYSFLFVNHISYSNAFCYLVSFLERLETSIGTDLLLFSSALLVPSLSP